MNDKKYIIKNCPSCRYTPKRYIDGIDYICWNAQKFNSSVRGLCQDCTDCVLKQIINQCKETIAEMLPDCGSNPYAMGRDLQARLILQKFDIEECE